MVEYHNKSFFGSLTGMFFDSSSWTNQNFYLKFIKKKNDGTWEKPSEGEGKSIKFSLEEMTHILRVLKKEVSNWKTFHKFEQIQTPISFEWDKNNQDQFHVKGGDYHKMLNYAEITVFKALLEHVFEEKIARSTVNSKRNNESKPISTESAELTVTEEIEGKPNLITQQSSQVPAPKLEKVNLENETAELKGICEGNTEKAVLILFDNGKQIWIPKSTIRSENDLESSNRQPFVIDIWVLKKNEVFA